MRNPREEAFLNAEPLSSFAGRRNDPVLDFISAVKGLHGQTSQELGRLIREAESNIIRFTTKNGLLVQIGVDRLVRYLALHLLAAVRYWRGDAALFKYLLSGFQLLHSLCYLAPRPAKIEQIFVDNTKVFEQIIDLILYMLIYLTAWRQDLQLSNPVVHLHSTLVASSLYLLTACVSSQWQELAQALLLHSKVDMFMDVVFAAVRIDIKFLQTGLSAESSDSSLNSSSNIEEILNHLCQQCEASLQFLQSCCQQKCFRERLVKNKELCGKGGVLLLVQAVLDLNISEDFVDSPLIVASISRMKSKVLSILLHLCEAESVSYLDEVASNPGTLDLAKSIALEVLDLLKSMFGGGPEQPVASSAMVYPKGQLQLNGLRLADIFSDDSNFRSYITAYFTEVLTTIFSLPHGEFLSSWCSSELPVWEEDASLEYDPCASAAWTLDFLSSKQLTTTNLSPTFTPFNVIQASYAHQRTSLLVKVIANLHCFVPDICKEEKDLFLNKFLQCLTKEIPKYSDGISAVSEADKAATVTRNLSSLLSHAESLIPSFLIEEDVQLLRVFIGQLESQIKPAVFLENQFQEAYGKGGHLTPIVEATNHNDRGDIRKEDLGKTLESHELDQFKCGSNAINLPGDADKQCSTDKVNHNRNLTRDIGEIEKETGMSGLDLSSTRGKDPVDVHDTPAKHGVIEIQREEKMETVHYEEKHPKKRKRTIMNDKQIVLVEKALKDEPDMHRNAASLFSWADKLSALGSEVTTSQLKNWLNNRKARMSRVYRVLSEADNSDRQGGLGILPSYDSPSGTLVDVNVSSTSISSTSKMNQISGIGDTLLKASTNESSRISAAAPNEITWSESVNLEPGQYVLLLDQNANEIGKGKVHQVDGYWGGKFLRDSGTCAVDIIDLKIERLGKLPYPSELTGTSFDQAEKKLGSMRVLWDVTRIARLQSL